VGGARRKPALTPVANHLIERLPPEDRQRLLARCELIELGLGEVLCDNAEPAHHVFFPTTSFVSLLARNDDGEALEVGLVGSEGMLGVQFALGVTTSSVHGLVQGAGTTWRVEAAAFQHELATSLPLQRGVHSYVHVLMVQLATAAACLRYHLIEPRLARWLLMCHDRAHHDHFRMTHEFLSYMLGVRRAGVTAAASDLQRRGLIAYHRGDVSVLDRAGLEAASCSCYAANRRSYDEVLA
jgi:CRP-like cAMP-binding protein